MDRSLIVLTLTLAIALSTAGAYEYYPAAAGTRVATGSVVMTPPASAFPVIGRNGRGASDRFGVAIVLYDLAGRNLLSSGAAASVSLPPNSVQRMVVSRRMER